MPNIITIDPRTCIVSDRDVDDAELNPFARTWINHDLDHGTLGFDDDKRRYVIIVYGLGLVGGPYTSRHYFSINRQLFNGRGIVYCANERGETIDVPRGLAAHWADPEDTGFLWISSAIMAERLINQGAIVRPESSINGQTLWQWSPTADYERWRSTTTNAIESGIKKP